MPLPNIIDVKFEDTNAALGKYIWNQITSLTQTYEELHKQKIVQWRRWYKGQPEEEARSFPWKNASNLVVQLIGTHVDQLRARVLASIFEILPIYVVGLIGEWVAEEQGEEQRAGIEEFMNIMALEPKELDLYRVISNAADECIKVGSVFLKSPWETDVEQEVVGYQDGRLIESEIITFDGPRPGKIPFEKFLVTPTANTLETAEFKCHIVTLTRQQLEYRRSRGIYSFEDSLLETPDSTGLPSSDKEKESEKNVHSQEGFENATWDIHECWFPYVINGKKYRLGPVSYHLKTKKILKAVFNFYPDKDDPFDMGRLGYTDDGILGYGFCEMLSHYQMEMSTLQNQSIDNNTLLNTSVLRVAKNSKLDANFSIFPMAILPGEEGEIEKFQLGSAAPESLNLQRMILDLARMRSGVDPGMQAAGGGVTNPKKGIYSAMGTFSVMQEGNRRVNINITDLRYLHLKLGRKFLKQYATFGVGDRLKPFGNRAAMIQKALENIKNGRMSLPIRAATGSINKEIEKQNDMMLTQVIARQQQSTAGILQAVMNPMMPPVIKEYLVGVVRANSQLYSRILRNFGHDDVSRLLPELKLLEGQGANNGQTAGANGGNGSASTETVGANPVVQTNGGEQRTNASPLWQGGEPTAVPIS